jgi:hypothetical protein
MEAMMALYAKEVATPDAVAAAIARLSHLHQEEAVELKHPTTPQQSLMAWLNCSSKVMNTRLKLDGASNNQVKFPLFAFETQANVILFCS